MLFVLFWASCVFVRTDFLLKSFTHKNELALLGDPPF